MDTSNETPAPTDADIGRVYLHNGTRVVLINDRLVADQALGDDDHEVVVKQVEPVPGLDGLHPVTSVDYRVLTVTDEWIVDALDMPITDKASARAFMQRIQDGI